MRWRPFLIWSPVLLLLSCYEPREGTHPLAFFHWKNRLALSPAEVALLDSLDCQTLYVKFLDVAREAGGPIRPYALLQVADTTGLSGRDVVPCVFLTNSVFYDLSDAETEALARKVALALADIGQQFPQPAFSEVQLDCDWTDRTRQVFFLFLKKLKPLLPPQTRLSATIRLHQYKFPNRTGVPPVERGLLMLYNTGDIQNPDEENSIFSLDAALRYLEGTPAHYPLPLDVALPAFGWTLVYRDGRLWKIGPEGYKPPPYDGEQGVRTEVADTALLRQAAQAAARVSLAPDGRVAFFRLDSAAVRRYSADFLREVARMAAGSSN
ncbi:MAG: hypothetical protein RMJ33_04095 [Saprospiraceae bacterium]|nr:hypothetical protein [Saprospiraceae bacterium]MDW8228998.1 hypothetical protein [Saprospiraceae bacterium]